MQLGTTSQPSILSTVFTAFLFMMNLMTVCDRNTLRPHDIHISYHDHVVFHISGTAVSVTWLRKNIH